MCHRLYHRHGCSYLAPTLVEWSEILRPAVLEITVWQYNSSKTSCSKMYQNMCNSSVSDLKSLSLCWWRLVAWCTKINLLPFFKVKIVVLKEGIIGWYLRSQTPLFTNKSTKTIFKHILLSFTNVASIYEHAHTWIVIVILTTTNAAHRSTWDAQNTARDGWPLTQQHPSSHASAVR